MVLLSIIFIICFIIFLLVGIIKSAKKQNYLSYLIASLFSFVLFVITSTHSNFSFILFILVIILTVMGIMILKRKINYKNNKRFIIVFAIIFVFTIIFSMITSDTQSQEEKDNPSSNKPDSKNISSKKLTKEDVDKMSDDKMSDYIFDADDDRGEKLYKEDKNLYKYLFKKYFDVDYDSVNIPTKNEIDKMSPEEAEDLSPEQSIKLSFEDEEAYSEYISKPYPDDSASSDEKTSESDSSDDTSKLKSSIQSELNSATIDDVSYYSDSLGNNATIIIKGEENLSNKMTVEGMRFAVAEAVKGVKNSDIKLDDFTIDVTYPVDENGKTNNDFHVIKSKWSMDTVESLSNDQMELLNTDLDSYAESYSESTALN